MKKRGDKETKINLLNLIPVQNIKCKKNEEGLIVLLKPKFKNPFLTKHILPRLKKPNYKISLDDIGSYIWALCDGNRTVKEIAKRLKDKFGEKIEPLYDRLSLFLQSLEKNNFIEYKNK